MARFLESINQEYAKFKASMLSSSPELLWDECCKIYFYCSFYEFFLYNESISYVVAEKLADRKNIIADCWELYQRNDELSILSWEDIGKILEKYIEKVGGKENE